MLHQFCPSPLLSHQICKADPPPPPHLTLPSCSVLLLLLVCYSIFLVPGEWSCKVLPPFQEEVLHWGGISNGENRVKYSRVFLQQNWLSASLPEESKLGRQAVEWVPFPLPSKTKICANTGIYCIYIIRLSPDKIHLLNLTEAQKIEALLLQGDVFVNTCSRNWRIISVEILMTRDWLDF